jgi:hypothetical protein
VQQQIDNTTGIEHVTETIGLLNTSRLFHNIRNVNFTHHQVLDLAGLIGLAKSRSYTPERGESYDQLVQRLTQLHQTFCDRNGRVVMQYQTNVFLATAI